jgi:hypothetical protein
LHAVASVFVIRIVVALVLLVVGVVWFGQGIGLIGGSFMTGEAVWAVIGAVAVLFALALLRGAQRARQLPRDN